MRYDYVFWDWNGTILNDVDVAVESLNSLLTKYGYNTITKEKYREIADTPIKNTYEKIFDLNKHSFESLAKEFNFYYDLFVDEITLNKGVLDKLNEFKANSVSQIILSSSATSVIKTNLNKFKISDYFDDVLGADDYLAGDKIIRAERYLKDNHIDKSKVIFVGDISYDYKMAEILGVDCALVSCGHQSTEQLLKCNSKICHNISEIDF